MEDTLVKEIVEDLKLRAERSKTPVPIGVSNRHVHFTKEDFKAVFGADAEPALYRQLRQPGFWAANEQVTIQGPKGAIKNVRMIGPYRTYTQVEVSLGDSKVLGLEPPIRDSGKLDGSPGIKITGPKGSIEIKRGVILLREVDEQLMRRVFSIGVFSIDVLACPRCGGRMRILCAIHPPEAIRKILDCLGIPSRPPPIARAIPEREVDEHDFY